MTRGNWKKPSATSLETMRRLQARTLEPDVRLESLRILHRDGYINGPDHTAELTDKGQEALAKHG